MSNVTSALAKNSVLQIGGKVLGTLFGLITFYFLLEFFGTAGYGVLTRALTFVSLFAILVDFGLTLTATQMISEEKANEEKILGNLLTLRLITALGFLALAPISALFMPAFTPLVFLISLAASSSFFASVAQTFIGVFQKRLSLTLPVLAETLNRLTALGVILLFGATGNIAVAGAAFLLGGLVHMLVMLFGTARFVRLRPAVDWVVWQEIIKRSAPIGLSIFFNLLYLKGDILFMSLFAVSDEVIGQYGAAYKVVDVVTMVPVTFMGLMLPLLTGAFSNHSAAGFNKHLQNTFDLFSLLAIPLAMGSLLLGVEIMTAVKPDLVLAGQLLAILGPAAAIVFYGSLFGHAVLAINKQRVMTWGYLLVAVLALTGYIVFIPLDGVWAAAWVTLFSETLITLLTGAVVIWHMRTWPNLIMTGRALLGALAMAAVIILLPSLHIAFAFSLAVLVYVLAVMALGGPKPKTLLRLVLPDKPPVGP